MGHVELTQPAAPPVHGSTGSTLHWEGGDAAAMQRMVQNIYGSTRVGTHGNAAAAETYRHLWKHGFQSGKAKDAKAA